MITKRKGPKKAPRRKECPHGVIRGECAICDAGDDPTIYGYAPGAAGKAGKIKPPHHAKTCDCHPVLRLPIRSLACSHPRNQICQHCVEGIPNRVMYREALNHNPRILRLDAWRVSLDSNQRNDAGMQDLKTTMAELQRQVMLHEKYVCDGCVHCKEDARP